MKTFSKLMLLLTMGLTMTAAVADEYDWGRGAQQIDTAIGKLDYMHAAPSKESAQKLYDEMDYQRATQAYIDTIPFVSFQAIYEGLVEVDAGKVNDVPVFSKLLDSTTCVFTGNETTIYGLNVFYLNGEPAVLEVPAGALAGMIDNAWQQELTPLGLVGPNEGKGGKFLILPPDYEGEVPPGYTIIQSDTNKNLWMARGFVTETSTADDARALIRSIKPYTLAQAGKQVDFNYVDLSAQANDWCYPDTNGYFDMLARGFEKEPGRDQDKILHSKLRTLGIKVGEKRDQPDERMQNILAKAEVMGRSMATALAYQPRDPDIMKWDGRYYENIILGEDTSWEKEKYFEIDRRALFAFQAATTSFAMIAEWVGKGSKYFAGTMDHEGNRFDGGNTYRIPVPASVPAGRFWSVTLYDTATRSILANKNGVASIDSYADFERNKDGTVDIITSPDRPRGMERNWIQTNPGQGFYLYFRIYSPEKEYYTSFIMDDIEHVKDGQVKLR